MCVLNRENELSIGVCRGREKTRLVRQEVYVGKRSHLRQRREIETKERGRVNRERTYRHHV